METNLSIALRAHAVLLSASVAVFTGVCLCVVLLLHPSLDASGSFVLRALVFGLALLGMLYLRQRARCAFETALRRGQIGLSDVNANGAAIADDCPHAWLVQLYVELAPVTARRQIASKWRGAAVYSKNSKTSA
jgi:hypothetical protein